MLEDDAMGTPAGARIRKLRCQPRLLFVGLRLRPAWARPIEVEFSTKACSSPTEELVSKWAPNSFAIMRPGWPAFRLIAPSFMIARHVCYSLMAGSSLAAMRLKLRDPERQLPAWLTRSPQITTKFRPQAVRGSR